LRRKKEGSFDINYLRKGRGEKSNVKEGGLDRNLCKKR